MSFLYTISIFLYGMSIRIASAFNPKARLWVKGRRGIFKQLKKWVKEGDKQWKGTAWFHCASLGEFEQGRPVIERFRETWPEYRILLTFYSPSGYEVRKNYPGAEGVFYLPLDTPQNARKWIRILDPKLIFFIKYEYWFNFLHQAKRKKIPVFIVSAIFHDGQPFFKWYGRWFREQLKNVSWFFLQHEDGKELAESLGIKHYTIADDTRFDRVYAMSAQKQTFPDIEKFVDGSRIFLGGSTWEPDEALVADLIEENRPGLKFIIAPHEVHPARIRDLEAKLRAQGTVIESTVIRFSELTPDNATTAHILIVDTIGILGYLYQYADISMIGGGFGAGIHNILEAAAFGSPVVFGPNYRKFTEANELIRMGGAFCVSNTSGLKEVTWKLLENTEEHRRVSGICKKYVEHGQGATGRILKGIQTLGFIAPPAKNKLTVALSCH